MAAQRKRVYVCWSQLPKRRSGRGQRCCVGAQDISNTLQILMTCAIKYVHPKKPIWTLSRRLHIFIYLSVKFAFAMYKYLPGCGRWADILGLLPPARHHYLGHIWSIRPGCRWRLFAGCRRYASAVCMFVLPEMHWHAAGHGTGHPMQGSKGV